MNIDDLIADMPPLSDDRDPDEGASDRDDQLSDVVDAAADSNSESQAIHRHVPGAKLVFKRKADDGTFSELWVFHTDTIQTDLKIRRQIISGTDIPPGATTSTSGEQQLDTWTCGNVEFIHISGLPA